MYRFLGNIYYFDNSSVSLEHSLLKCLINLKKPLNLPTPHSNALDSKESMFGVKPSRREENVIIQTCIEYLSTVL